MKVSVFLPFMSIKVSKLFDDSLRVLGGFLLALNGET